MRGGGAVVNKKLEWVGARIVGFAAQAWSRGNAARTVVCVLAISKSTLQLLHSSLHLEEVRRTVMHSSRHGIEHIRREAHSTKVAAEAAWIRVGTAAKRQG